MPEDLDQVASATSKNVEITGMRVALQRFLDLQRQAVHAAAHVGVAGREPYADTGGDRDHPFANALTTAAAKAGGIDAGMRTRAAPTNSTSFSGAAIRVTARSTGAPTSP